MIPDWIKTLFTSAVTGSLILSCFFFLVILVLMFRGYSPPRSVITTEGEASLFQRMKQAIHNKDLFAFSITLRDAFLRLWVLYMIGLFLIVAYAVALYLKSR